MADIIKTTSIFLLLLLAAFTNCKGMDIYFRFNQMGFLTNEYKSAIILSDKNLSDQSFKIIHGKNVALTKNIGLNNGPYGKFKFSFKIEFSEVNDSGQYYIEVGGEKSEEFTVGKNAYSSLVDSLLTFFKVQRCGFTNPILHQICHKFDVTGLIDGKDTLRIQADLTGGWHDAGDYVKFLNTTAFSTYLMLFSYEFDKDKFGFDRNSDGVPDILEEAKIGLDWLQRCEYKNEFITQVQTLADHEIGWRLPEDDILKNNRPGFLGTGKNLAGIYSAVMALAARIWEADLKYLEYSKECLRLAKKYFSLKDSFQEIDSSGTGMYIDNSFAGKIALGAVELFLTTNDSTYFKIAVNYADSAGSDYWWGWGNVNSLAHYRLGEYGDKYKQYIKNNLVSFKDFSNGRTFEEGVPHRWGTNMTIAGIVLENGLYKRLTGSTEFDTLAVKQRDFLLGRNPWGISFFTGFGNRFSENLHHQVSKVKHINLPGGFAAGPVSRETFDSYKIKLSEPDRLSLFQSDSLVYFDDVNDYLTNEPTISANATAIFIFGNE